MQLNAIAHIHSQEVTQGRVAVQSHLLPFDILLCQRQNQTKHYPVPV